MNKTLPILTALLLGVAAAQTTTTTTTTTSTATTTTLVAPVVSGATAAESAILRQLNAEQAVSRAQELQAQAEVAYPLAFYDRILWRSATNAAFYATVLAPNNNSYRAYLAELYTVTGWWINAYRTWSQVQNPTRMQAEMAAESAARLAGLALQRGDTASARTYVTQGLRWAQTEALLNLQRRL